MKKLVWDTSALINIKEPDANGYSPAESLFYDLSNRVIDIDYQHIFPALAVFETQATVSRIHREGRRMLRDFYLMDENSRLYDIDQKFVTKSYHLLDTPGFDRLRGADLVFACIAAVEGAILVTLDKAFKKNISDSVVVLDLNDSLRVPSYRGILLS